MNTEPVFIDRRKKISAFRRTFFFDEKDFFEERDFVEKNVLGLADVDVMFKCAPYIKSICSSLGPPAWFKEPSSLPASPIRQAWQQQQQQHEQQQALEDVISDEDEILRVSTTSLPTALVTADEDAEGGFRTSLLLSPSPSKANGAIPKAVSEG